MDGFGRRQAAAGEGINTSAAIVGYGPPNASGTGAPTAVRLSPHYYNTDDEIDTATAAIAGLVAKR